MQHLNKIFLFDKKLSYTVSILILETVCTKAQDIILKIFIVDIRSLQIKNKKTDTKSIFLFFYEF